MAGDWLKLYRRSIESQVFSDPHLWHLFCWCLLRANWKPGYFQGIEIPAGSFATGRDAAGESLGLSGSAWYRRLKKLESMGVISVKANNRFTVISVLKWSFFQNSEQQENNGRTTDATSSEQPADTIEEGNKSKKERNIHTHTLEIDESTIPPELLPHWRRWCEWRLVLTGAPINAIASEAILMELGRRGTEKAIRDIEFSILKEAKTILDSDNDFQKRQSADRPKKKHVEI